MSGFGSFSSGPDSVKVLKPSKDGSNVNFLQVVLKAGEWVLLDLEVLGNGATFEIFDDFPIGGAEPPVVVDADLGIQAQGSFISHQFELSRGTGPINWTNLTVTGPGIPRTSPALAADGLFTWDSTGSPLGLYRFQLTATNIGSGVGTLTVYLVPEPVTTSLIGLAMVAPVAIGIRKRRLFDVNCDLASTIPIIGFT
jgi:hypothetical protein